MIEINNILSTMIWLPILGGLSLLLIGDAEEKRKDLMRMVALAVSIITFLLSINLYSGFDNLLPGMQFVERSTWIESLNIEYYLGIDGISAPLIILTAFITPFVVVSSWDVIKNKIAKNSYP